MGLALNTEGRPTKGIPHTEALVRTAVLVGTDGHADLVSQGTLGVVVVKLALVGLVVTHDLVGLAFKHGLVGLVGLDVKHGLVGLVGLAVKHGLVGLVGLVVKHGLVRQGVRHGLVGLVGSFGLNLPNPLRTK